MALDIYSSEPGYLQLGQLDSKFLGDLYRTGINLSQIPLKLAQELQTLSLTRAELKQVVSDLINGPDSTTPETSPIDEEKSGTPEFATLSFLLDHEFSGQVREDLVISSELAFASSFFQEVLDAYDACLLFQKTHNAPSSESIVIRALQYRKSDTQLLNFRNTETSAGRS